MSNFLESRIIGLIIRFLVASNRSDLKVEHIIIIISRLIVALFRSINEGNNKMVHSWNSVEQVGWRTLDEVKGQFINMLSCRQAL